MSDKKKIICVVGPTASGKTALGVKIAKLIGGEIISADSMQIYKGMSIASAAPTPEETDGIPHHLVEFLPYGSQFTVYDWLKAAKSKISEILEKNKIPVIVGGTGLYINCLVDNLELLEIKTDKEVRKKLEAQASELGGAALLSKLKKIDAEAADKLHENDTKRIIRALEIYETAGITPTQQNELSRKNKSPYDFTLIEINYSDRQKLYDRINLRVDKMLEAGLLEEAKIAFDNRTNETAGAVQAIGHKEFFPYFEGEITLEQATENLKRATRRYAKRQITWFGARDDINRVYADGSTDVFSSVKEILEKEGIIGERP